MNLSGQQPTGDADGAAARIDVDWGGDDRPRPVSLVGRSGDAEGGAVDLLQFDESTWQLRRAVLPNEACVDAFADRLPTVVPRDAEVLVRDSAPLAGGRAVLERSGRTVSARKGYYTRALTDLPALPEATRAWTTASFADLGADRFAQALARCADGDPGNPLVQSEPARELADWIEAAGDRFDPTGWVQVGDGQGPLGIVLPQVYEDEPELGTLFYVGVEPARRRTGNGVALHAWGLHRLRAAGAKEYAGSTDLADAGMRAVFEHNGCRLSHQQWFYTVP